MGKTTLTRKVATSDEVTARFGDRCWFVELETVNDRTALQSAIMASMGLKQDSVSFTDALSWLRKEPSLLVLDNLETPWEADKLNVEETLQQLYAVGKVSLLASLRGSEEPDSPDWTEKLELLPLRHDEAVAMFLDVAEDISPQDPDLADLISQLGGIPLAIWLVAKRAAGESTLAELWSEWKTGFDLAFDPDVPPERRTSLPRSLELSWQSKRLHESGRRLFQLLGQLPAGLALADRKELLGKDAREAKQQLYRVGLCFVAEDERVDLLPPIREYAKSISTIDDAWKSHYVSLLRDVGKEIWKADGDDALLRLTPELPNIEAALQGLDTSALHREAVGAVDGAYRLMSATGAGSPTLIKKLADACAQQNNPDGDALWSLCYAYVTFDRADRKASAEAYEYARALFSKNENIAGEGFCVLGLGDIEMCRFDLDPARAVWEVELTTDFSTTMSAQDERPGSVATIADYARSQGETLDRYTVALGLFLKASSALGIGNCVQRLGDYALRCRDVASAREAYLSAREFYQYATSPIGVTSTVRSLGDVAFASGNLDEADRLYEEAKSRCKEIGSVLGEASCTQRKGDVLVARGESKAAAPLFEEAGVQFRGIGSTLGEASCFRRFGRLTFEAGEYEAATMAYQKAAEHYEESGSILGNAHCRRRLGDIADRISQPNEARRCWDEAVALYQSIGEDHEATRLINWMRMH